MAEADRTDDIAAALGGHPPGRGGAAELAGLDGLRALAVGAVITYHVDGGWLPGGYLGVDVFFGISGFLITYLLVGEHGRRGRIALADFWRRRAVRLLPELLLVLTACAVVARLPAAAGTGLGDGLRGDAFASLAFVGNWWQIHEGADYFHHLGTPPMLQHLWSLSVEEQFYLVWPVLLAVCLALVRGRRRPWLTTVLGVLAAAGAGASLWRMHELSGAPAGVSRAYFGTDSHSGALLAGCAAALLLPAVRWAAERLPGGGVTAVRASLLALALLAVLGPGDGVMYGWGFAAVAVATTLVCAGCAVDAPARLLDAAPLRLLGRHSYGLYLWHWPVIVAGNALFPASGAAVRAVEILAPLPLAVAGRHLVQRPVAAALRPQGLRTLRSRFALPVTVTACAAAVSALAVSPASAPSALQRQLEAGQRYEAGLAAESGTPATGSAAGSEASPAQPGQASGRPFGAGAPPADRTPAGGVAGPGTATGTEGRDVTMIGDSISLGSAPDLDRVLPGIDLHAEVGRMMDSAPDVCAQLLAAGRLRHTVVLALGTNAEYGADVLDRVRAVIGPRTMVLMTVRGPFAWQDEVNSVVRAYHDRHPEVLLDDWYATANAHQDLLWIDHTHPRGGAGTTLFATSLAATLPRQTS